MNQPELKWGRDGVPWPKGKDKLIWERLAIEKKYILDRWRAGSLFDVRGCRSAFEICCGTDTGSVGAHLGALLGAVDASLVLEAGRPDGACAPLSRAVHIGLLFPLMSPIPQNAAAGGSGTPGFTPKNSR